jgi:hypothetical protein
LPFGGDVRAAMRASDRAAIRTIFEWRQRAEGGGGAAAPAGAEAGAASGAAVPGVAVAAGGAASVPPRAITITVADAPPPPRHTAASAAAAAGRTAAAAAQLAAVAARVAALELDAAEARRGAGEGADGAKARGALEEKVTSALLALDGLDLPAPADRPSGEVAEAVAPLLRLRAERKALYNRLHVAAASMSGNAPPAPPADAEDEAATVAALEAAPLVD